MLREEHETPASDTKAILQEHQKGKAVWKAKG